MSSLEASIKRHPVLTYFALTFALSYGGVLLVTGGFAPMFGPNWQSDPRFMFGVVAGPIFAAAVSLLLTGLIAGKAGFHELRVRLLRWRVAARWYALALLLAPLSTIGVAVLLALSLRTPEFLPDLFTTNDPVGLLLPGLASGLLVGICEELGWTGFVIPRLRVRYGILATGLIVGLPWGAWHFPLFWEADSFSGGIPLILLLAKLFAWLPAYRVLMVWVYDHTESLLLAMLMHVSVTASQMALSTSGLSDMQVLVSTLVWAGMLWVAVAAVGVTNRGTLSRQPLRRRPA